MMTKPLQKILGKSPKERRLVSEGYAQFDHLAWKTSGAGDTTATGQQIVTLHEWAHHELNNVTTYGAVLTILAQLARRAKIGRERYRELFKGLTGRSRTAHEVYATWFSVDALSIRCRRGNSSLSFLDFIDALELTGHATEPTPGSFQLRRLNDAKIKITIH